MQTVLFHDTVFGPIHSRRLGTSLGINLLPNDGKICTFDCLYCEAGFNSQGPGTTGFPSRQQVRTELEEKLKSMKEKGEQLDVITFSGNGEPTLHPDFESVMDDTVALRDKYFPEVKISVLSNSTRLDNEDVVRALHRVDNNILKLDSAIERTMRVLDRPNSPAFSVEKAAEGIVRFGKKAIVQTMFTYGTYEGLTIDNTTDEEVDALIEIYRRINPGQIMIYSIDRKTPAHDLHRVMPEQLQQIAERIRTATGIPVSVA